MEAPTEAEVSEECWAQALFGSIRGDCSEMGRNVHLVGFKRNGAKRDVQKMGKWVSKSCSKQNLGEKSLKRGLLKGPRSSSRK